MNFKLVINPSVICTRSDDKTLLFQRGYTNNSDYKSILVANGKPTLKWTRSEDVHSIEGTKPKLRYAISQS